MVIEQPSYAPWAGYFGLMSQCDLWIWYDDVQFTRRDWRNRNRLADAANRATWITVPVKSKGGYGEQRIDEVEIDEQRPWRRKHLGTLAAGCGAAPEHVATRDLFSGVLDRRHGRLADLAIDLAEAIAARLGIVVETVRSSSLTGVDGKRQQRLLEILERTGATSYLSGPAARSYIDPAAFSDAGLELYWANYDEFDARPYPRLGRPFVPRLSILDPLAWLGGPQTAAWLRACMRAERDAAAA